EPEAEDFENHCLECESCWEQLRAGAELRASSGLGVFIATPTTSRTRRDAGPLLAAAAALVVMFVGLRQVAERPGVGPTKSIWRSERAESLRLQISRGDTNSVVLRWPTVSEASSYNIEVFASDGESIWQRETTETEVTIAAEALARTRPGI